MKMRYRTAVSSLPKRVWGMHQPIYDDFPYLANHISNLRYAWNAQRRAAVAWLNLVNRWLTRVAQRSKCRLDWGLTLWLYHPSLLNKSWRLQLLDVLWACQDTTDGAPVIEKEAVQEFGCLDIYFTLVTGFEITQRTGRRFSSTCPHNHCNLRQWTETQVWSMAARAPVWSC